MTLRVEGAGVGIAVHVRGQGEPVLLVHGLATDSGRWDGLPAAGRLLALDRRGCGESEAPVPPYARTTVEEQAEDAVAVLDALDARGAVAVGEDFGALVVLDVLKRHPGALRGAVLLEPPLFAFVAAATERLATEHERLEAAVRTGGAAAGVAAWADGRPVAPGAERAFFADYGALAGWPVTRGELRAIDVPLAVLVRPQAPGHVHAAARALAGLAPRAVMHEGDDVAAALFNLACVR